MSLLTAPGKTNSEAVSVITLHQRRDEWTQAANWDGSDGNRFLTVPEVLLTPVVWLGRLHLLRCEAERELCTWQVIAFLTCFLWSQPDWTDWNTNTVQSWLGIFCFVFGKLMCCYQLEIKYLVVCTTFFQLIARTNNIPVRTTYLCVKCETKI